MKSPHWRARICGVTLVVFTRHNTHILDSSIFFSFALSFPFVSATYSYPVWPMVALWLWYQSRGPSTTRGPPAPRKQKRQLFDISARIFYSKLSVAYTSNDGQLYLSLLLRLPSLSRIAGTNRRKRPGIGLSLSSKSKVQAGAVF